MSTNRSFVSRVLGSGHFVVLACVLLVAAAGWNVTLDVIGAVLLKERVEPKSLEELPESFGPRFTLAKEMHWPEKDEPSKGVLHGKARMREDVEESLGTKDYITWFFKDNKPSPDKPADALWFVNLHIAYYTGLSDAVPHVADACQLAGGAIADIEDNVREVTWTLPEVDNAWQDWKSTTFRRSAFIKKSKAGPARKTVVFYVFSVNGKPINDRLMVRAKLGSIFMTYCYYAKIEMSASGLGVIPDASQQEEMCRAFWDAAGKEILDRLPTAADVKLLEDAKK